jgi:hypothetical protein
VLKLAFRSLIGALLGSTLGFTARQLATGAQGESELTVGAPLSPMVIAFVTGLIGGRRALLVSFTAGAVVAGAVGAKLDGLIGQARSPSSTSSLQSSA